jgi:hypothetical protein
VNEGLRRPVSLSRYARAKKAIQQAVLIAKGEKPDCPDGKCLVKGRFVTQENMTEIQNL